MRSDRTDDAQTEATDEPRPPLQEWAAATLREAIIRGTMRPGERLSEPDLAQRFRTSRSPVREALVQLELEGFVARADTGRVYVRPLDLKEFEELFVVRATLEGLAGRLAAESMNRKDTLQLEGNIAAMLEASRRGDIGAALSLGAEFHRTVIDACGNRPLQECLLGFRARTSRYRYILAARETFSKERVSEHRAILTALKAQDPDKAEQAMQQHIKVSSRETLRALEIYLDSAGIPQPSLSGAARAAKAHFRVA